MATVKSHARRSGVVLDIVAATVVLAGAVWLMLPKTPADVIAGTPTPGKPPAPPAPPSGFPGAPPVSPVWPDMAAVARGRTIAVIVLGDAAAAILAETIRPSLAPTPVFDLEGEEGWFTSARSDLQSKLSLIQPLIPNVAGSRTWVLAFADDTSAVDVTAWLQDQVLLKWGDVVIYAPAVATPALDAWAARVKAADAGDEAVHLGGIAPDPTEVYGTSAARILTAADGIPPDRSIG